MFYLINFRSKFLQRIFKELVRGLRFLLLVYNYGSVQHQTLDDWRGRRLRDTVVAQRPETKRNKTGNKQFGICPRSPPRRARRAQARSLHRRVAAVPRRRPPYIGPAPSSTRYATAVPTTHLAGTTPHTRVSTSRRCPRASSKTPPFGTCAGNRVIVSYTHTGHLGPLLHGHDTSRTRVSQLFCRRVHRSAPNRQRHFRCTNASILSHSECVLYHD